MKDIVIISLLSLVNIGHAQTIIGKWKTIDDTTGKPRSIVEIFERNGMLFGKVLKIYLKQGEDPDPVCNRCPENDTRFNKKVIGMEILRDLQRQEVEFTNGNILDPENGKVYKCKVWIEDGNLKVRGYWGPFWRTQTWLDASD